MKNFLNPGSFVNSVAFAALSRLGACWRSRVRMTAIVLVVALFATSMGQDSLAQARPEAALEGLGPKAKTTLAVTGMVAVVSGIGVGVYAVLQHAHTVKGCVSDDPNELLLHTQDGKTYVLLGNTTKIKADTTIKVTGTRKKKIAGITDQPSFVVEKLDKEYGTCSVTPAAP